MIIRKYVGKDEKALLKRIRAELGSDAMILHTSFAKPSGFWRLVRPGRVEILAGGGFRIVKDYSPGRSEAAPLPRTSQEMALLRGEIDDVKKLIARQTDLIARQQRFEGCPDELAEEYGRLSSAVSENLAQRLIRRIAEVVPAEERRDRARVREALRGTIKDLVRCADGISLREGQCVRVAFIGPTGVGKTTTIAKLMSIYSTKYGKEVAVITNDTYRIAATEQIRRVAQLVGVPVRICRTEEEIERAIEEFSNRDLVLMDTAGRSQKNAGRISDLNRMLQISRPHETHLVVSLTSHPDVTAEVIQRFSACAFDRIVLTKLDEAVRVGVVFDVLGRVQKDLSFITTGQEIPRDIEIADSDRLASLVLGEETA